VVVVVLAVAATLRVGSTVGLARSRQLPQLVEVGALNHLQLEPLVVLVVVVVVDQLVEQLVEQVQLTKVLRVEIH
jgi:hypothetical protein